MYHWGLAQGLIALFGVIFILPESPKFLYTHKRFDEARELLKKIAKFNRGVCKKDTILL